MSASRSMDLQIAESLFITESTAGSHVSNILAKLDVGSRTLCRGEPGLPEEVRQGPRASRWGDSVSMRPMTSGAARSATPTPSRASRAS